MSILYYSVQLSNGETREKDSYDYFKYEEAEKIYLEWVNKYPALDVSLVEIRSLTLRLRKARTGY